MSTNHLTNEQRMQFEKAEAQRSLSQATGCAPEVIPMPEWIEVQNANEERCDMAQGPCCCGAWHTLDYWPEQVREAIQHNTDLSRGGTRP